MWTACPRWPRHSQSVHYPYTPSIQALDGSFRQIKWCQRPNARKHAPAPVITHLRWPTLNPAGHDAARGLALPGYRLWPWRSPYLRWRIETYRESTPINHLPFLEVVCHRTDLARYLSWPSGKNV